MQFSKLIALLPIFYAFFAAAPMPFVDSQGLLSTPANIASIKGDDQPKKLSANKNLLAVLTFEMQLTKSMKINRVIWQRAISKEVNRKRIKKSSLLSC